MIGIGTALQSVIIIHPYHLSVEKFLPKTPQNNTHILPKNGLFNLFFKQFLFCLSIYVLLYNINGLFLLKMVNDRILLLSEFNFFFFYLEIFLQSQINLVIGSNSRQNLGIEYFFF